jgi:hypothetical protein
VKICPEGAEWFDVGGRKEGRKERWAGIQFRQTYRGTDIQTDLQADKHTFQTDIQTERHTDGQTYSSDRHTVQTDKQTDRRTVQTDIQTDRHDETNSRFSQFFERA